MLGLITLVPLLILVANGFLAHWIVKKIIKLPSSIKNEKVWRALISVFLFLVFSALSFYLILINFRFER